MRKKIITSWIVMLGVILLTTLGLLLLYISPWSHEKSGDGMYYAQGQFEFGTGAESGNNRLVYQKNKNDAGFEYSINCLEVNGEIIFQVYYVYDISGITEEESLERARQIHERGDSVLVREQRMDKAGTYFFDLSGEKNGFYIFCIEAAQPDTQAKGITQLTIYSSNWSVLMEKIGVK